MGMGVSGEGNMLQEIVIGYAKVQMRERVCVFKELLVAYYG